MREHEIAIANALARQIRAGERRVQTWRIVRDAAWDVAIGLLWLAAVAGLVSAIRAF